MLSDQGSAVIRKFGILNINVPPDVTRFYGIPFPGQYLIAPDGVVQSKLFLADYQERPTGSEVLLSAFGADGNSTTLQIEDVSAKIIVSDTRSYSGHQLGVTVDFGVAPGWHIYGEPLPPEYTPTKIKFDADLIQRQSLQFPAPTPLRFAALDQTFPVYHGSFKVVGNVVLKQKLMPGNHKLAGVIEFQECNDALCKPPQSVRFELPLTIEPMVQAAPKT